MAHQTEYSLGIDLGGTKTYAVIKDPGHHVISRAKRATPSGASPEKIADEMYKTVDLISKIIDKKANFSFVINAVL